MRPSRVGRNNLCPCGSGRKFKRCCLGKAAGDTSPAAGGKFRFEAGSYGDKGGYAAAISCLKQVRPDEWLYHFVLANPDAVFEDEQTAADVAAQHLDAAFAVKRRTGSDAALAEFLKRKGYLSVDGFNVVDEPEPGEAQ
ncbi:MAG TPA: SEC-C metal-binding domain-containing protein [Myxococcota bacterium]|nr:SEC-C metal-binding domain-containing protein [Myxococcota bacterium]